MINRSYTWIDESVEHSDEDCAKAKMLAHMWSELATKIENKGSDRQARYEDGDYPEFDDEASASAFELRQELQAEMDQAQLDAIASKLYELGARMMRPYEHWNEDERMIEYMENRGDY